MNVKLRAGRESEPSAHSDSSVLSANLPRAATHWLTQTHTAAAEAWLGGPETGTFGEVSSVCSAALKKKKNVLCVLSRSSQVGCDVTLCVTDICLFSLSCGFFICFSSPVLLYIYIFFIIIISEDLCLLCPWLCGAMGSRVAVARAPMTGGGHLACALLALSAAVSGSERGRGWRGSRRRARHTETLGGWTGAWTLV